MIHVPDLHNIMVQKLHVFIFIFCTIVSKSIHIDLTTIPRGNNSWLLSTYKVIYFNVIVNLGIW